MADFNALQAIINAYIKRNGVQAITGQILNGVLTGMVNALGKGYTVAGAASPTTDPGTMTGPLAYIAYTAGTYTHFDNIVVEQGEVSMLIYNEAEWHKEVLFSLAAQATVDDNIGVPSVGVSFVDGVLTFDFRNMKGEPGENGQDGDPAGFGTISASISGGVGTPGVSVQSSGPDTAKNIAFQFTNLKGETGVTSCVVTVDNTTGNPSCAVSLVGQELHLDFSGLKGAQGNTGSSVDYPFTIVNNLTTDDATQALSAAMGVQLESEVSQLEAKVGDLDEAVNGGTETVTLSPSTTKSGYRISSQKRLTAAADYSCAIYQVIAGKTYHLVIPAVPNYTTHFAYYTSQNATTNDVLTTPYPNNTSAATNATYDIVIPSGFSYLYVSYTTANGTPTLTTTQNVPGLEDRVAGLENTMPNVVNATGNSSTDAASQKLVTDIKTTTDASINDIIEVIDGTSEEEYVPRTLDLHTDRYYNTNGETIPENPGTGAGYDCAAFPVTPGEKYKIYGLGGNQYSRLYATTDSNRNKIRYADSDYNARVTPVELTIEEGESLLYINFKSYDSQTDYVEKLTTVVTPGLSYKVSDLETRVENLENDEMDKIVVSLPDTIFAVVGDTLQLYYHSIFRCEDYRNYAIIVTCDIGSQYPRYYEVTPIAGQVGSHTLSFTIKDNNNKILGTKTTSLVVVPVGVSPASELNVLCVGASCTNKGQWASEFKRRLIGTGGTPSGNGKTNVIFVGRQSVTFEEKQVNLEATGGYSFPSYTSPNTTRYRFNVNAENEPTINVGDVYSNNGHNYTIVEINISAGEGGYFSCTGDGTPQDSGILTKISGTGDATITYSSASLSGNPFAYGGVIDMQQYADEYCNPQNAEHGRIDVVFTELFGNGTSPYTDDFTTRMSQMQTFINQIRSVFPNCKFCIGLCWNPDLRGGMGRNYGASGGWSDGAGIRYSFMNLCNALQKYITDNNLSDYVYILNWLNEFDTWNDMQQTVKKVNPRSSVTEIFGLNGVHPSTVGYNQMADSAWRLFVAKFCQSE